MKIKEYLKDNNIICDGAFGTYFLSKNKEYSSPEKANLEAPDLVTEIHKEYIEAGARLIRTNTFALSTWNCVSKREKDELEECLQKGYINAKNAVKQVEKDLTDPVFIAGDIGPAGYGGQVENAQELYLFEAECLINAGVDILVFESFQDLEQIDKVIRQIGGNHSIFIMVQFCVNQYGYSSSGYSGERLLAIAGANPYIGAVGFNCGIGPTHMQKLYSDIQVPKEKFLSSLPNAGYPNFMRDRTVYMKNIDYFVSIQSAIAENGISILGGCCGTTPEYIKALSDKIKKEKTERKPVHIKEKPVITVSDCKNAFYDKKHSEKIIAVELAPPFHADTKKIMDAANELRNQNIDVVTFPDSPSGRTRIDSIAMAIKVFHETGITVMPHLCCRDRNTIAITAQMLGAYVNDIRNFLVITGDPVPAYMRTDIKAVFNFNSVGMMQIMKEMNLTDFAGDEIVYGGALNCGCVNMQAEIDKMKRKEEAGANFFFTQPIFGEQEIANFKLAKEQTDAIILCGLMPLVSKKNALFIKNEIAGILVTDEIIEKFKDGMAKKASEQVGIDICKDIMRETESFADGYYFSIPFYRTYLINRIMQSEK